jgi:tetrahydromethanopterin S-methyltransferase subunit E
MTTHRRATLTSDGEALVMKFYLVITGALFGIFSAFHVWATLTALNKLTIEPGLVAGRAAIAVASGCLAIWAWRLGRIREAAIGSVEKPFSGRG